MKRVLTLFLILMFSMNAVAGTITGKVTSRKTGDPVSGAKVLVIGTTLVATTQLNGEFTIHRVPEGRHKLLVSASGYRTQKVSTGKVKESGTVHVKIALKPDSSPSPQLIEVDDVPIAPDNAPPADRRYQAFSEYEMAKVSAGSGLQSAAPAPEGFIPHNTEEYAPIDETGFHEVTLHPLSTFAADVDVASYGNVRRFIMQDQMPYADAVRIEELVNYFKYDYPQPKTHPLSVSLEYGECPWNSENRLVQVGIQGRELDLREQKPSNLVFLLDVSGSMDSPKKLPLLKRAFKLLVEQLGEEDRISIVVYAGAAGVVLEPTPGSERTAILAALDRLEAGGSTAGGAGIQLAYDVAKKNLIKKGNNRVILATDGDFNVGISSTSEMVRFIEEKRDEGIFLTVLGFGMGNYKDNRLQELADRGNGNHAYIDNILEAKKVLVNDVTGTLFTIAKDVKIQVEFNPALIKSYRLIGYENRRLAAEDFRDDKKDAGEIGAGHTVTALYEVVPADRAGGLVQDLKYQTVTIKDDAKVSDEVLTVRIRYKKPDGDKGIEFDTALAGKPVKLAKTSDNFRWASAVAEWGLILSESEFAGDADLDQVEELARSAEGEDKFGYRAEFLNLVERTQTLKE